MVLKSLYLSNRRYLFERQTYLACWSQRTLEWVLFFACYTNLSKLTRIVGFGTGRLRKALHSTLQPEAARNFRPVQEKAARSVITDILSEPEKFQSHIQTYAATVRMIRYLSDCHLVLIDIVMLVVDRSQPWLWPTRQSTLL